MRILASCHRTIFSQDGLSCTRIMIQLSPYFSSLFTTDEKVYDNYFVFFYWLQWNLSKADTFGTNIFFRFRQVSAWEMLGLWKYDL